MFSSVQPFKVGIAAAIICLAPMAHATTLSITVTNNQADGGFAVTPLYTAFHDGSFDAFTVGEAASLGVETIAETGSAATVAAERLAIDPDSFGTVIASPSGPPPIEAGESVTTEVTLDPNSSLFFTFLSMLLPSNDTFIGNDDPLAFQLFDAAGAFLGDRVIEVTGLDIYDAGTEVNGLLGSAFVAGQDITLGADEGGVVTAGQDLSVFAGATLATGATLGDAALLDFFSDPSAFSLLTIEITEVAPVPLPAGAPLLAAALGLLGLRSRRKV